MENISIKASAPGSLMLMGEHAVLEGQPALCAAINKRINVVLTPREDQQVHIHSALGEFKSELKTLTPTAPFEFVIHAILKSAPTHGFELTIESDFEANLGLGSSSAVTVATLLCLEQWIQEKPPLKHDIFLKARHVIQDVQGTASGADVAASCYGGVIRYSMFDSKITPIVDTLPIEAIYSGKKTPTAEVIQFVQKQTQEDPTLYEQYYKAIGQLTDQSCQAIQYEQWKLLARFFKQAQCLMSTLKLDTPEILDIIEHLKKVKKVTAAKISGSGLGDCVIALGEINKNHFVLTDEQVEAGVRLLKLKISAKGMRIKTNVSAPATCS